MEEWVGTWWHRAVTRVADRSHAAAGVDLESMRMPIGLMFRAAGGAAGLRIAPAGERAAGGARRWIERLAGSGMRAAKPLLEPELLALPPRVAVFADRAANRDLYLWLAALAAHFDPSLPWLAANLEATQHALQTFPGLRHRHAALVRAHLAQRPDWRKLGGEAARAERLVQCALAGEWPPGQDGPGNAVGSEQVRPVCLWMEAADAGRQARAGAAVPKAADKPRSRPSATDTRRRRAQAIADEKSGAPFILPFRAESLLSWSEMIKVDRATDDSDDGNALRAADDLDVLSVAPDGQTCASTVKFDLDLPSAAADDLPLETGRTLPEWDYRRGELRPDYCALQIVVARPVPESWQPPVPLRRTARRMRRRLELLRAAPRWAHAMTDGEELDLDAWVRHATETAGSAREAAPAIYRQRVRADRSLASLLLADLSLSTDAHVDDEQRVVDVIRDALYVFGEGLAATGDAFEMLGFSSVKRDHVRIQHLKGFDEPWADAARQRVGAIKPGFYTRMGAAVREGTQRLSRRGERQRLLLLLTDGKPNDLDIYEGRYGLEDTRHAVQAARQAGLTPFCVTIDAQAHDYLPMLFGEAGYALVRRPGDLVRRLAGVYAQLTR